MREPAPAKAGAIQRTGWGCPWPLDCFAFGSQCKHRKKGISRQGDKSLRKLFALGASAHLRVARAKPARLTQWQRGILARRPVKVAVLAQAAKNARIAWVVLTSGEPYRRPALTTA
jgi:transposase